MRLSSVIEEMERELTQTVARLATVRKLRAILEMETQAIKSIGGDPVASLSELDELKGDLDSLTQHRKALSKRLLMAYAAYAPTAS